MNNGDLAILNTSNELKLSAVTCSVTTANAGSDQTGADVCGLTTVTLAANEPTVGTGAWSIVSGSGGSFANNLLYNSEFTGVTGTSYVLRWTISNPSCTPSTDTDDVTISLNTNPTTANAGSDQSLVCGTTESTLAGNTPSSGTGAWSVVSGAASIDTPSSPISGITGLVTGSSATLRWTVSNSPCASSIDDVVIYVAAPTTASAGSDQSLGCGVLSATLAGNSPGAGSGAWSVVSGTATVTSPTSQTSTVTGLVAGASATLRWTVTNSSCVTTDDVVITTAPALVCPVTVTDVDSNVYDVVKIGCQCWMADNLKTSKYRNGVDITNVVASGSWSPLTSEAWCYYNNNSSYNAVYGKIYNWYAVNDNNGLCPTDWHVASDSEWMTLVNYLGGLNSAGGKLKETGTSHWSSPNTGATNSSGFTAVPGGQRYYYGPFSFINTSSLFWTSTANGAANAYYYVLSSNNANVSRWGSGAPKNYGYAVRCVMD